MKLTFLTAFRLPSFEFNTDICVFFCFVQGTREKYRNFNEKKPAVAVNKRSGRSGSTIPK